MISDLVINISLLTSFTFLWHQLLRNHRLTIDSPLKIKCMDGLLGGVLGIILLHYSIQVTELTILDLRHIPIILLAYYGGMFPAFLAAVVISVGRFMININFSSFVSMLMVIIIAIGSGFIVNYIKWEGIKLWTVLLLFSQLIYSIALYVVIDQYMTIIDIAIIHAVCSIVGGYLLYYFVTYIRRYTELYNMYKRFSQLDSLTGLYNVRSFHYFYNLMIEKALKNQVQCAICMIDIDFFKKINDTYGHLAGDQVLKQLASLLKKYTREDDIVSRNGGEEFSILLENCSKDEAEEIASRIRRIIETNSFTISNKRKINITVSIGVASHNPATNNLSQLYQEADEALYKAKQQGRNNVFVI